MSKFKSGDRVVITASWGKGRLATVVDDYKKWIDNPAREVLIYADLPWDGGTHETLAPIAHIELEEIYNSPLYQALL